MRGRIALLRFLRLYLDPLALFENINVGSEAQRAEALRSNLRRRGILLSYARRWAVIAVACLASANPLASAASEDLLLCVPFVAVELGFALAFCTLVISISLYVALVIESRRAAQARNP